MPTPDPTQVAADAALAALTSTRDTAKTALDKASADLAASQKAQTAAEIALDTANTTAEAVNKEVADANALLAALKKAAGKTPLNAADPAVKGANDAIAAAATNKTTADGQVAAATKAQSDANTDLTAKTQAHDAAVQALADAETELANATALSADAETAAGELSPDSIDDAGRVKQVVTQGKLIRPAKPAPGAPAGTVPPPDPVQVAHAQTMLSTFADQVLKGKLVIGKAAPLASASGSTAVATNTALDGTININDTATSLKNRIAEIDKQIELAVNQILHDEKFQQIEASWRSIHHLLANTQTSQGLKLRVMDVKKDELETDLGNVLEFDQSSLFKKIYEEEYGTFGGEPFSCLLGDYQFGPSTRDVTLLGEISHVAAAAHAPFLTAADPALFDLETFADLGVPRDLEKIFASTPLIPWSSFRSTEDSRYVALTLPRVLAREPYRTDDVEEFGFSEDVDAKSPGKFLWGNSAYALAERITFAFAQYGWCAAIRGVEGGGLVESLPFYEFLNNDDPSQPKGVTTFQCPTETAITDRREAELNKLGFIALCHRKNSATAAFFGGQTANKPKVYNTDSATANASTSAMLPYILAASRFAHYIKVMMRDKIGSFESRESVQKYLNTWISDYVLLNDVAPQITKAQYPLREARVDVAEVPGKPGSYTAVIFLRPHFQLEELSVSLRLVATLPPPVAA